MQKYYRVLIVEDNTNDRDLLIHELLKAGGFVITAVSTGQKAVDVARRAEFEVAMIDLSLPDIPGIDVIRELRRIAPDLVICIVTGCDDPSVAHQAFLSGAAILFPKPYNAYDNTVIMALLNTRTQGIEKGLHMNKMSIVEKWLYGLLSGVIGGSCTAGLAWVGLAAAHGAGADVPVLNFKALGIIMLSGGLSSAMAYLKQSPLPPIIEETTTIKTTETKVIQQPASEMKVIPAPDKE